MGQSYLVCFGIMRQIGRFVADSDKLDRKQIVVVRSTRGTELGEIIAHERHALDWAAMEDAPRILRLADASDLAQAARLQAIRSERLAACESVLREGVWPIDLLDVEPLFDERRTVIHYLGPRRFDASELRARLLHRYDIDAFFEAAGRDPSADEAAGPEPGCGNGECGCGESIEPNGAGSCARPGDASHACDGCAVRSLVRRAVTH